MDSLLLLVFILSQVSSDPLEAEIGEDITLSCESASTSIKAVEWNKNGLKSPEYVLFFCDGHSDKTYQNPSFVDRVHLQDKDMKNGNVSLVLKNVTKQDEGDYECRVSLDGSRQKRAIIEGQPIKTIKLKVKASGDMDANVIHQGDMDANVIHQGDMDATRTHITLIGCVGLLVLAGVVQGFVRKRNQDKNSDLSSGDKAGVEALV